jgi:hypothetical protein
MPPYRKKPANGMTKGGQWKQQFYCYSIFCFFSKAACHSVAKR